MSTTVVRSPNSPLGNVNDKKGKRGSKCNACSSVITAGTDVLQCQMCKNIFDISCASISVEQFMYFEKSNVPWFCYKCFYEQSCVNNNAVNDLSDTILSLKSGLENCIQTVDNFAKHLSGIRQEFNSKVLAVQNLVVETKTRMDDIESNLIATDFWIHNLIIPTNNSNEELHAVVHVTLQQIFKEITPTDFIIQRSNNTNKIKIICSSKALVKNIQLCYQHICAQATCNASIVKPSFQLTFDECSAAIQRRVHNLESSSLQRDIKISGIPMQLSGSTNVPESYSQLKTIVVSLAKQLGCDVTSRDFTARRLFRSHDIIISFHDKSLRDDLFFKYISAVKNSSNGGISSKDYGQSFSSKIIFNDHLSEDTRIIQNFARNLKKSKKIQAFSTRRGRIAIKITDDDDWIFINSTDHLHSLLNA